MIDPLIFKAYDIRAIYPNQLDEEGTYKIGRAFVDYLKVKEVVVGYDSRIPVGKIRSHLIAGINDAGAKVIDIGMTGTEVMYFTVGHYKYNAGIMITASHNPKEYAGFKMVKENAFQFGAGAGSLEILKLTQENEYKRLDSPENIEKLDTISELKKTIQGLVDFAKFKPLKIIVDAGNGVGGILFNQIFSDTNLEIVPMHFKPDGNFPHHLPNPLKEENTEELRQAVLNQKADLGISLDGDGDRAFFFGPEAKYTLGYFLVILLGKEILKKYPNGKIVYEVRNTWAIEDEISKAGGVPVKFKAGNMVMKEKMREINAVFGGETSSHFFYRNIFYADSSMLSIALLLKILSENDKNFDEILAPLKAKYFVSGEYNYTVKDADKTLEIVQGNYENTGYEIDNIDGIAVANNRTWRFSLRKSNTEPLVRLNVEGESQEIVDSMQKEVEKLITS